MLPDDESIPAYLDRVAIDSADCFDVSRLIQESGLIPSEVELDHVKIALDYHRSYRDDANFEPQPFSAQISLTDGRRYPPPLEEMGIEIESWVSIGVTVSDPLVKSRLNHLAWAAKHREKYSCALRAIDSYLTLLHRDVREEVDRSNDFGYALSIALQLNDDSRIRECVGKGLEWFDYAINCEEKSPGAIITTLTILSLIKVQYRPANMNELIEQALTLFDDPHLLQHLFEIQISLATDLEMRKSFARKSIDAWIKVSKETEGLIAALNLDKALEQARAYDLSPEIESITLLIQQLDLRPHMQLISVSTTIPTDEFDRSLDRFLVHETWQEALTSFGEYCPIPDNPQLQAEEARTFLAEHPFQSLVRTIRVDAGGRPEVYIRDSTEQVADRVAIQASEKIQIWSVTASVILHRIVERWAPEDDELSEFFRCETIPETSISGFVRGFRHYSENEWESSLQVTLPRIEESLRTLTLFFGLSILIPRRNHLRKRNAGELLDELKVVKSDGFFNYLDYLLVNEDSTNLRNRAVHGLIGQVSGEEAALAIHAACALRVRTPLTESGNVNPPTEG